MDLLSFPDHIKLTIKLLGYFSWAAGRSLENHRTSKAALPKQHHRLTDDQEPHPEEGLLTERNTWILDLGLGSVCPSAKWGCGLGGLVSASRAWPSIIPYVVVLRLYHSLPSAEVWLWMTWGLVLPHGGTHPGRTLNQYEPAGKRRTSLLYCKGHAVCFGQGLRWQSHLENISTPSTKSQPKTVWDDFQNILNVWINHSVVNDGSSTNVC